MDPILEMLKEIAKLRAEEAREDETHARISLMISKIALAFSLVVLLLVILHG